MNEITNLYKLLKIHQYKVINFTPHFLSSMMSKNYTS